MLGIDKAQIVHTFDGKSAVTKYYRDRLDNIKDECQRLEDFLEIGDRIYNIRYYYMQAVNVQHEAKSGDYSKKGKRKKVGKSGEK